MSDELDALRRSQQGPKTLADVKGLVSDEGATALAEFVVLMPVYSALFIGLIYLGHLAVIRQQVHEATRFLAWQNDASGQRNSQGQIKSYFFNAISGFAKVNIPNPEAPAPSPIRFEGASGGNGPDFERVIKKHAGEIIGGQNGAGRIRSLLDSKDRGDRKVLETLAFAFLDNKGGANALNIQGAKVDATYTFPMYGHRTGIQSVTQNAMVVVYMPNVSGNNSFKVRRVLSSGLSLSGGAVQESALHPVEDLLVDSNSSAGLQSFQTFEKPWIPFQAFGPINDSSGPIDDHQNIPSLWNTRHDMDDDTANPFFSENTRRGTISRAR